MADDTGVNEAKAKGFVAEAENRLKGGFFENLTKSKDKFVEAAELFAKAANFYKLAKKLDLAASAYAKAGDCYNSYGSKHDAATSYNSAGQAVRKINVDDAVQYMTQALKIQLDEGRFTSAAKGYKDIAEVCEAEQDLKRAVEFYMKAGELYEGENNSTANANGCFQKAAAFYAQIDEFEKGAELWEKVASNAADNRLLEFSLREYLLKAAFCRMAMGDAVGVKRSLDKYSQQYFKWNNSTEARFVAELASAIENFDQDAFRAAVQEFDSTNKLDQWKTSILAKIQTTIQNPESDLI